MSSPADRLVYMANQIGTLFRSQGHDKAVPGIADHIKKFWDPRMKRAIFAHLAAGGAGLAPNVLEALASLKQTSSLPDAPHTRAAPRSAPPSRAPPARRWWRA